MKREIFLVESGSAKKSGKKVVENALATKRDVN